jgi:hypothetical protein
MRHAPLLSRSERLGLAAGSAILLALRLPFLPVDLEDIDSINFHLGVHDFYPFAHQPHPPGYAVFIALAKLLHPLSTNHAAALALPSVLCSALVIWPLYLLLRTLTNARVATVGTILLAANPVFWMNSVRPMSDMTGLFVVLAAQAAVVIALVDASRPSLVRALWLIGVALGGLAVGVRPQAVMLVGPILIVGWRRFRHLRVQALGVGAACIAAWLVPTVLETGGLGRLLSKQNQLIAESFHLEPLVSRLSMSAAFEALADVFVNPWGSPYLGAGILAMAVVGAGLLIRRDRRAVTLLLTLFAPYLLYHYVLQWTPALRYSLPILPLVVALAASSVAMWRRSRLPAIVASAVVVAAAAEVTIPALRAYSTQASPPMQAVAHLRAQAARQPGLVVAGHDVFERYLADLAGVARVVRTRPGIEWRGLNRYWTYGGDQPVWFLNDPSRSTLRLVDPESQSVIASWRWPEAVSRLLQGARPMQVRLVRINPPEWFAESGAFLMEQTPGSERSPAGPHLLFVRAAAEPRTLGVFGIAPARTNLEIVVGAERTPHVAVTRSFAISAKVPATDRAQPEYVPVMLEANHPFQVTGFALASESEDSLEATLGFFPPEQDESGEFQWVGPRGEVAIARSGPPLRLSMRGWIPTEFFEMPVQVVVGVDGQPMKTETITSADFRISIDLPAVETQSTTVVSFEASSTFVPDAVEHNGDRRQLTFRAYDLRTERTAAAIATPEPSPE